MERFGVVEGKLDYIVVGEGCDSEALFYIETPTRNVKLEDIIGDEFTGSRVRLEYKVIIYRDDDKNKESIDNINKSLNK